MPESAHAAGACLIEEADRGFSLEATFAAG